MAHKGETKRNSFRALYFVSVKKSAGFTYIEVLVTFSLTVLILASLLSISGAMVKETERNADQLVLQREASALYFLLLNEIRQGYNFHVTTERTKNLYFQVDELKMVKLEHTTSQQLVRRTGVPGSLSGHIVLRRYVDHVTFHPDADGRGVEIRVHFKKGDAVLTTETYWRSRIERDGVQGDVPP